MFESADSIKKGDVFTYVSNGFPFAWELETDDIIVGGYGSMHSDNGIGYKEYGDDGFDFQGRIWIKEKLIGFWDYPKPSDFKKVIDSIEDYLQEKIWDNNFQVEIYIVDDKVKYGWSVYYDDFESKLIPIEEYVGSEDVPEDKLLLHLMDQKEKELYYKKHGKQKGFGSDKTSSDSDNPIEWRQAKMKSEKMVTKFKKFRK